MTTEPFESFASPLAAKSAIMEVMLRDGAALPERVTAAITASAQLGGVEPILTGLEALWHSRALLSADSLTQLGQIAQVVAASGFGEQGKSGRAYAMLLAIRRDRGEAGEFPPAEDDPAPDQTFDPPEPEPEEP